ncbi:MAG: 2'-5' RNA ligase family protein [Candidatus Kerfeldbacteria bacterium]|nr:2'-5' RNA ligase family protein [Candidatus Kerfeldbacteria bacterium]
MDRYTLVALVPEPHAAKLAALRKQHDVFTRQWLPPHITILPPFEYPLTRDEIATIREFPVNVTASFDGWGAYHRAVSSVLYLKTSSADPSFSDVIDNILRTMPQLEKFRPQDFGAHVTVVSRIPNDQFDAVEAQVATEEISGTFTIDRLMLYRWDDEVRRWIAVTMVA